MRVVHILPHLRPGGAERIAVHIMRSLDHSRFEVIGTSLGPPCDSDLEHMLDESGIPARFLNKRRGFDPRAFYRIYGALRELHPHVVHTHGHVMRYALPSLMALRPPVMIHTVHSLAEHEIEPRARWTHRLAFRQGVKPVAVSQAVADSIERLYGVQGAPVVPNCVPVSRYSRPATSREEWRAREGFCLDDVLIVSVAQFRAEKRHAALLEAFARGPASNPRARLLLAGRGDLEPKMREQAAQLGIASRVRFLGIRWDVPDVLGACDIFVLASEYEGSPVSVLEAMAAGLPLVCTAVGGTRELVRNGRDGLAIELGDCDGFARAMQYLADNPVVRRSMGAASARRARESFDLPRMAEDYARLYEDLFSRSQCSEAETASLRSRFGLEG